MLRRDGVLPVVAALAPAVQHAGIGTAWSTRCLPKVGVDVDVRELVELDVAVRVERRAVAVERRSTDDVSVRPSAAIGLIVGGRDGDLLAVRRSARSWPSPRSGRCRTRRTRRRRAARCPSSSARRRRSRLFGLFLPSEHLPKCCRGVEAARQQIALPAVSPMN